MKTLGDQIKIARQQHHMSQSELARRVGCKQSALSMFEGGRHTALNASVIGKLCDELGLLPPSQTELAETLKVFGQRTFCPNPECPSNLPLMIGDRQVFVPHKNIAQASECHCAWCGEVLERACTECGAIINNGAFCTHCGTPYLMSDKVISSQQIALHERLMAWNR